MDGQASGHDALRGACHHGACHHGACHHGAAQRPLPKRHAARTWKTVTGSGGGGGASPPPVRHVPCHASSVQHKARRARVSS